MTLGNRVTAVQRLGALRRCIDTKGCARILEAHSGLSGIIVENARLLKDGQIFEYDGIWESSLTDSGTKGLPDASIVGSDSRCHTIDEILNVTSKPVVVDGILAETRPSSSIWSTASNVWGFRRSSSKTRCILSATAWMPPPTKSLRSRQSSPRR